MKVRRLASAVGLVLAMLLAGGCGTDATTEADDPSTTMAENHSAELDALKAQAEEAFGSEPWFSRITEWRYTTMVGAPTLALMTDIDRESPEAQDMPYEMAESIASLEPEFVHNIDVWTIYEGIGGQKWSRAAWVTSGGTQMAEAFDLPEAPTGNLQMEVWMEGVFGPGGLIELGPDETWYDSIESYAWEAPDGGGEDILIVRTSMTYDDLDATDLQFHTLNMALNTTGSPLLREYQVLGQGDEWLLTIYSSGREPGTDGPNY